MRASAALVVLSVIAFGSATACTNKTRVEVLAPGDHFTRGDGFGGVAVMSTGDTHGVGEGTSIWGESHGDGRGPFSPGAGNTAWHGSTSRLGQYVEPVVPAAPTAVGGGPPAHP